LRWHFRLVHLNFPSIQQVLKGGWLGNSPSVLAAGRCQAPNCASCLYFKAKRRPAGSIHHSPTNNSSLMIDDLRAGQTVSMDHFVVRERGRLYESRGKTLVENMYTGGCIFVDHASGYIYIHFQVLQNSTETIEGKMKFERHLFNNGIVVRNYHTDNGIFNSKDNGA
jgi:hypothetical protein